MVRFAWVFFFLSLVGCAQLLQRKMPAQPIPPPKQVVATIEMHVPVHWNVSSTLKDNGRQAGRLLFEYLRQAGVQTAFEDAGFFHLGVEITSVNKYPRARLRMYFKKPAGYPDKELFRFERPVRSSSLREDVEALVAELLNDREVAEWMEHRRLYFTRESLPTQRAPDRVVAVRVRKPRIRWRSPKVIEQDRLRAEIAEALEDRGFATSFEFDFNLDMFVDVAETALRVTFYDRATGSQVEHFALPYPSKPTSKGLALAVASALMDSPVFVAWAEERSFEFPFAVARAKSASEVRLVDYALVSPKKLVLTPFEGAGVDATAATALSDLLLGQLHQVKGLSITEMADVQGMANWQRISDLLGCDTPACQAELAAALEADYLVRGKVSQIGSRYSLMVSVLMPSQGKAAARASVSDATSLDGLTEKVSGVAWELARQLGADRGGD